MILNLFPKVVAKAPVSELPFLKKSLLSLEWEIHKNGLQKGMLNWTRQHQVRLITNAHEAKFNLISARKPVILLANHPSENLIEVILLLASLPSRKDAHLIMNADFINLIPSLDKHAIPVYIKHHQTNKHVQRISGKLFCAFHPTPTYPPEIEHKKNIQSIKNAANKVKKGGMVIMFPGTKGEKNGKWQPGIGHLINNIGQMEDGYIIQTYIEGTSSLDYLRIIPGMRKILPKVTVTFSSPKKISAILKKSNHPKEITTLLEKQYKKWVETLKE